MKIVHVSTHGRRGGAGQAAWRLHAEMRNSGIDSSLVCLGAHEQAPGLIEVPVPFGEAANRSMAFRDLFVTANRTPVSNTYFSDSLTGSDLNQHPKVRAADIIHLHWVSGLVRPPHLAQFLFTGKTVVWTLHDLAPFTGGCHYPAGCTGYLHGCRSCPQLRSFANSLPAAQLADKLSLWTGGRLSVIALNSWMAGLARQTPVFKDREITIIPNGIDLATFNPAHRAAQRHAWGVSDGTTVLLFAADLLTEVRKGAALLASALGDLAKIDRIRKAVMEERIVLLAAGEGRFPETGLPVKNLGWCNEAQMARNYAGADLFVLPSQEDNQPNTVVESLACGTPVAAFAVGGVPEMILDGVTGRLAPGGQADSLVGLLREVAVSPAAIKDMRPSCRAHAEMHFDVRVNTQAVVEHYRKKYAPAPRTRTQRHGDLPGPALAGFLESPSPEILGLNPSEFLTRVTTLADRTQVEQVAATARKQSEFIEVLQSERDRLVAEAGAAHKKAKHAAQEGQKHIDALSAQLDQVAATCRDQAGYIEVLTKERDRLTTSEKSVTEALTNARAEGQRHIRKLAKQLEQQSSESQGHIDGLRAQLEDAEKTHSALVQSLKTNLDQVAATCRDQIAYIDLLTKERDRLATSEKSLTEALTNARAESQRHIRKLAKQLEQQSAESQGHIDGLRAQLEDAEKRHSALVQGLKTNLDQVAAACRDQAGYIEVLIRERDRLGALEQQMKAKESDYLKVIAEQSAYLKQLEMMRPKSNG